MPPRPQARPMPTAAIAQQQYLPRLPRRNGLSELGAHTSNTSADECDADQTAVGLDQPRRREPVRCAGGALGFRGIRHLGRFGGRGRHANALVRTVNRPCGRTWRKITTSANVMTCAMLPLVQSVRYAVTTPDDPRGDQRALELPDAAGDDHEERRDDVGRAERRVRSRDEGDGDASDPCQAGAEEEGDAIDAPGRDTHRLGQLTVLHRRTDPPTEPAVLQHGVERCQRRHRQHDREELAVWPVVTEHRDAAAQPARRVHRIALRAEDVLGGLLQDQRHADGRQERVERPFVHPLDDGCLQQQPEEAGDEEGHRDGDHDREAGARDHLLGHVGRVGAGHEELAVGHVDHAHLSERERQAERRQQQDRPGRGTREEGSCE